MKYFFLAMLLMIIWVFFWGKLHIHINYKKDLADDRLFIELSLGKFFKLFKLIRQNLIDKISHALINIISKNNITALGSEAQLVKKPAAKTSVWQSKLRTLRYINLKMLQLTITRLHCQIKVSAADAAVTALLFGSLQAGQSVLLAGLNHYAVFREKPQIAISPDFQSGEKEVFFDCIVTVKIGNIIHMLKNYAMMRWRERHG